MRRVAGLVLATVVAAGQAVAAPAVEASVEVVALWIDGRSRGDTLILVDRGGIFVPAAELCAVRLCRNGDRMRDGVPYVSLARLRDAVTTKLDLDQGELHLKIALEALTPTRISMRRGAPSDIEHRHASSMFLNYAVAGELGEDDRATLAGTAETGLSIAGTLAYTSLNATRAGVVRGMSSWTFDHRTSMTSLVAGDRMVSGGMLGGGGLLGGLHLGRDLSLDPYFVAQPTLTHSGAVATTSTVEIYRDGQLVRRELIPAGPFSVDDITAGAAHDAQVVVRDAFGLTQAVATSAIPPASALRPGFSVYDVSIGMQRQHLATKNFDYGGGLAGLATYRRGLTRRWTVGARAEASADVVSAGGGFVATAAGVSFEVQAAASAVGEQLSAAGGFSVGWHRRTLAFGGSVRAVGKHYATIDLRAADDRTQLEVDGFAAWSASSRLTFGSSIAFDHRRDSGDRSRAGLTAGLQLGTSQLFATAAASHSEIGLAHEVMITLALFHGSRTTSAHSLSSNRNDPARLTSTLSRSLPGATGVGYQASASVAKEPTLFGTAVAQGQYGRAEAMAQWQPAGRTVGMQLAGGVVAIEDVIRLTRPVRGGYALVRVPGTGGVRTTLDNQAVGETDSSGVLVIPDLAAFYGNRLRIDIRDLPIDVATDDLERVIAPYRRSGVVVAFAPAPATLVRGRIAGRRGDQPLDVSYGALTVDGGHAIPIGHDGAFEIEAVAHGRHRVVVEVEGERCAFDIDVRGTSDEIQLGTQACVFAEARK